MINLLTPPPTQGLQNTSDMEAKRMLMSFCATQWMLCKSPVYLEQSEFNSLSNPVCVWIYMYIYCMYTYIYSQIYNLFFKVRQ